MKTRGRKRPVDDVIDLCGFESSVDADDSVIESAMSLIPVCPADVAPIFATASSPYRDHFGASDTEVLDLLIGKDGCQGARVLYVPSVESRIRFGEKDGVVVIIDRTKHDHFKAYCFDFVNKIKASVGTRGISMYIKNSMSDSRLLTGFVDISPRLNHQVESECGAVAALYGRWFATTRTPQFQHNTELNVPLFSANVAAQMTMWRAARAN
jgi:hypothetical protein